jgi:hypothetical protein
MTASNAQHETSSALARCEYPGCNKAVSNPKYKYCVTHWRELNTKTPVSKAAREESADSLLTAATIGEHIRMPSHQLNAIFSELGWINKQGNGWVPTQHGRHLGAQGKVHSQSKVAYVVWPFSILDNNALKETLSSLNQETRPAEPNPPAQTTTPMVPADNKAFRERFPASHRTLDGHMVRSKGEVIIDNWLYMSRIVHAYERKLPIAEEVYCDF